MGRKPNPKPDDPEQSKRFVQTANDVGADDPEALTRAFTRLQGQRRKPKNQALEGQAKEETD